MVSVRRSLPKELGEIFTTSEAAAWGVGRGRLRSNDIERIFPGVFGIRDTGILKAGEDEEDIHVNELWRRQQLRSVTAFRKVMRPHHFFCGRTAAVILGLPVPPRKHDKPVAQREPSDRLALFDRRIEVASFVPDGAPRLTGVKSRRVRRHLANTEVFTGTRVTTASTTWAMLADDLETGDLVALGDAILRQDRIPGTSRLVRQPHASLSDLEHEFSRGRRPGADAAARAFLLLVPHSASPPETHLRLQLKEWGFPEPTLDYDVCDSSGRLLGASEIAFPEFKIALEYEGDHHRVSTKQWNRDIDKVHSYTAAGWLTVRVTAQLLYVRKRELFCNLDEALRARGWQP